MKLFGFKRPILLVIYWKGPHLQHNEHVQLQRLILQRQGEVECHYNVLPGLSPITTWYKVKMRDAA